MPELFNYTEAELVAIGLSVKVAIWCTLIAIPLATATGWFLARKSFRGKSILEGFLHLPLILPPVTTGYLLLLVFGTKSFLGSFLNEFFGIRIAFSFYAAVLASIVVSFPLVTRAVKLAIEFVDQKYEVAASTLGASNLKVFFTITLPLAMPGVISGFILCFARSLGEFGATITFAGNIPGETQTLPLVIYSTMQMPGQEILTFRLVVVSVIISLAAMIGAEVLNKRVVKRNRQ